MTRRSPVLLALCLAERRRSPPVPAGVVAEFAGRLPTAVADAFRRLDDAGLVDHDPDDGAALTRNGRHAAETLHETYATLCWLCRDVLDVEVSASDAIALAGVVGPDVAERLDLALPDQAKRPVRVDEPGGDR